MTYATIIRQGLMTIFENSFEAVSDEEALKVHTSNIEMCEKDITVDWDTAHLIVVGEDGNILKFID